MIKIYEAHTGLTANDHNNIEDAVAAVEAHGSGYVVTFIKTPHGDKSAAMRSYQGGAWHGVDISR